jgi:hypothetical protein
VVDAFQALGYRVRLDLVKIEQEKL